MKFFIDHHAKIVIFILLAVTGIVFCFQYRKLIYLNATKNMDGLFMDETGTCYIQGETTPFTGEAVGLFSDGRIKIKAKFLNGSPDGKWTEWYDNGNVFRIFEYREKQLIRFQKFYQNGNKHIYGEYKNGKAHGKAILWFDNGQKKFDVSFSDGLKHGEYVSWYANGDPDVKAEYTNGKQVRFKKFPGSHKKHFYLQQAALLNKKQQQKIPYR